MGSVQTAKHSSEYRAVNADLVHGEVVDFNGVDAITNIFLHPFAHFAVPYVGKIFDGATQLGWLGKIIGGVME